MTNGIPHAVDGQYGGFRLLGGLSRQVLDSVSPRTWLGAECEVKLIWGYEVFSCKLFGCYIQFISYLVA